MIHIPGEPGNEASPEQVSMSVWVKWLNCKTVSHASCLSQLHVTTLCKQRVPKCNTYSLSKVLTVPYPSH